VKGYQIDVYMIQRRLGSEVDSVLLRFSFPLDHSFVERGGGDLERKKEASNTYLLLLHYS